MSPGRIHGISTDVGLAGRNCLARLAASLSPPARGVPGSPRLTAPRRELGHRLILGAYLHEGRYPEPLAGHIFVALEEPSGARRTFGFSPVNFRNYDPHRDLGKLIAGVSGAVHDDESAFARPGVKTRAYAVDAAQADAAMAVVEAYRAGGLRFSLARRQCATFALEVLRAARIDVMSPARVVSPRAIYLRL